MFDLCDSKIYGKFKDELKSIPMSEFIALNPKVYSIKYKLDNEIINKKR